jgi:hypothetical protein
VSTEDGLSDAAGALDRHRFCRQLARHRRTQTCNDAMAGVGGVFRSIPNLQRQKLSERALPVMPWPAYH